MQYLFAVRGGPGHLRSDNVPEFIAKQVRRRLDRVTVRTLYINKARPFRGWENAYVESFNGKLRDELLNGELFLSLSEARCVLDEWRLDYNHRRLYTSLNWQTSAAFAASLQEPTAGAFPAASSGGRVAKGGCPPPAPTEPDLWVTHPALQVARSLAEQRQLAA